MGASTLGYKPWERFSLDRIAPTENDVTFRKRQIQGDVHDPGAAMKGGVAGHAGLFSNANDLAMVMQMLAERGHLWRDTLPEREGGEGIHQVPVL